MEGKAEISGIKSEEDINKLVHEVREELWEKRYADNDFG